MTFIWLYNPFTLECLYMAYMIFYAFIWLLPWHPSNITQFKSAHKQAFQPTNWWIHGGGGGGVAYIYIYMAIALPPSLRKASKTKVLQSNRARIRVSFRCAYEGARDERWLRLCRQWPRGFYLAGKRSENSQGIVQEATPSQMVSVFSFQGP